MKKTLKDYIRPEAVELLPMQVLLSEPMPEPDLATRMAPGDIHHAEGYICETFYKPISRCEGH